MTLEQKQALMRERQLAARAPDRTILRDADFEEQHYTVAEIAKMWKVSHDTVRRLFANEPGVLVIGSEASNRGTRRHRTLRIPKSVVERVYRKRRIV